MANSNVDGLVGGAFYVVIVLAALAPSTSHAFRWFIYVMPAADCVRGEFVADQMVWLGWLVRLALRGDRPSVVGAMQRPSTVNWSTIIKSAVGRQPSCALHVFQVASTRLPVFGPTCQRHTMLFLHMTCNTMLAPLCVVCCSVCILVSSRQNEATVVYSPFFVSHTWGFLNTEVEMRPRRLRTFRRSTWWKGGKCYGRGDVNTPPFC